jgi:hypothetical protein
MGVYQTFEQAVDRICELFKTCDIIEKYITGEHLRYYAENNVGNYYDLYYATFFYDNDRPLTGCLSSPFKEKPVYTPKIVNK